MKKNKNKTVYYNSKEEMEEALKSEQTKKFSFRQFFIYLGFALILAVPFSLFVRINPLLAKNVIIMHRICNGLFYGGVLVGCWGLWGLAYNLGSMALFNYSIKKTWQVVFNRGNADLGEKKLGTYDEYLASRKKKTDIWERVLGGIIPIILSSIIYLVY